ncbi:MAG: histidine kinase [Flavobacteriaceae bacterium]|nr:MAG: histidine kinase [Flavobacteriaceae bacterium]
MKKLFVHHPLFRLLSPLFSGTLVYLLILLINNNIGQLEAAFLGQELYVCIGLAYLIQEYARVSLVFFERLNLRITYFWKLVLQVVSSIIIGIGLVTGAMYAYFTYVLAYTPNSKELLIFNSIFAVITFIYLMLYVSHQFLHKVNTNFVAMELAAKQQIEDDFQEFKKGVNPQLLFESLESLLVLMKRNPEEAELLSDHFSSVYRYILLKKNREVVPFKEEMETLQELLKLFTYLPYRKIQLGTVVESDTWVVPGSLLTLVERIMRSTIPSDVHLLTLDILETPTTLKIQYQPEEVLRGQLETSDLGDISRNYQFYSDSPVQIQMKDPYKIIELPKLNLDESSHN